MGVEGDNYNIPADNTNNSSGSDRTGGDNNLNLLAITGTNNDRPADRTEPTRDVADSGTEAQDAAVSEVSKTEQFRTSLTDREGIALCSNNCQDLQKRLSEDPTYNGEFGPQLNDALAFHMERNAAAGGALNMIASGAGSARVSEYLQA